MVTRATRRLIDAAAKLKPADRALLNLWVNRGLDDERLAAMTGMPTEALQARRENIVARLAADLGLPKSDVRAAIDQISPDDAALHPPGTNGGPGAPPERHSVAAVTAPPGHGQAAVTAPSGQGDTAVKPPRRRRLWLGLAALAVIVAVMIVIVAGARSSSPPSRRAADTTPAPTTAIRTPTTAATPAPAMGPVPLTGLPGGRVPASGSVKLAGSIKHLRLNLRVKGLPLARAGHYEVWLYNSVLDSRPLARLRSGHHAPTARLLAGARRYRWIDISFQPVGTVNHSGESVLRASNPAHSTMARLRRRSARSRHRLRPAAKVPKGSNTGH